MLPTDINGETPAFYFKGMDKFIHAIMYGTLSLLVMNGYLKKTPFRLLPVSVLLLITWAYSVLMELLQYYFVAYRSGDFRDVLANLVGIFIAFFIVVLYRKLKS